MKGDGMPRTPDATAAYDRCWQAFADAIVDHQCRADEARVACAQCGQYRRKGLWVVTPAIDRFLIRFLPESTRCEQCLDGA